MNYFYPCVTSHFPSMPQNSAYFTLEYKMLLYFKLFDTSSTAHVEPNLPLFPSKCYRSAFSHHPPIPLHRSLRDDHLSHSCHAGWDILMIPWEYALWRKGWCISSENKVIFTCWSFFLSYLTYEGAGNRLHDEAAPRWPPLLAPDYKSETCRHIYLHLLLACGNNA